MSSNLAQFFPVRLRMNEIELCSWLSQAQPGDALEYHRGFLGIDRTSHGQPMTAKDRADLIRMGERAMRLAEQGYVHLVQRRIREDTFSYLAIARARPVNAALSFATMFEEAA